MAPRRNLMWATPNCLLSEGSFFMPQSSVFLIPAPVGGSKPALRYRKICANFSTSWLARMAAALKLPANISSHAATRPVVSKLTLRAQAPYTFSS